jgi:hypothetical protein
MKDHGIAAPPDADNPLKHPERLVAANINPLTGLSTDYLNHFSEAIMLLDFVLHIPECRVDLDRWRPVSYREHFVASDLRNRDLALAAYGSIDETTRRQLDATCEALDAMILDARKALVPDLPEEAGVRLVTAAMARLKPMFARASAIIRGLDLADGEALPSGAMAAGETAPVP